MRCMPPKLGAKPPLSGSVVVQRGCAFLAVAGHTGQLQRGVAKIGPVNPGEFSMDKHVMTMPSSVGRPKHRLDRPARRGLSLMMAGAMGVAGVVAFGTGVASAAVPTFPDNVVVFPNRDFVTIEGYQDHIGETATMEVTRGGSVVGSAQGVVAEGDVAFEVNHPGGVCWGNGTNLKVTPDIQSGDKVTIKFAGTGAGDTTVADAAVGPNHANLERRRRHRDREGPHRRRGQPSPDRAAHREPRPDRAGRAARRPCHPRPADRSTEGRLPVGPGDRRHLFTATYVFDDPGGRAGAANAGRGAADVLAGRGRRRQPAGSDDRRVR